MDLSQVKEKLVAIKELLDSGLISQEDFDKEKAFLLGSFTGSANTVPAPVPAPANMPTSNVTPSAPKTVEQCTAVSASSNSKNGSLVVGVDRDVADPALFRLQVQAGFDGTVRRKRLMVLLLDRSGSMSCDWPKVVDSVSSILTPDLTSDPDFILKIVVYAVDATVVEVPAPDKIPELINDLRVKHKPLNQRTAFRSAFRAVTSILEEELANGRALAGYDKGAIDLQVLLFTDGCDTSMPSAAQSAASARSHFDDMKTAVKDFGLESFFVYVAAYSANHDPAQCQYMSNKYQYIDRPETLKTKLATLIGEMTSGAGMCSIKIKLPNGFSLAEPIPEKLPVDGPQILYHVFVVAPTRCSTLQDGTTAFKMELSAVGSELQECKGFLVPSILYPGSFKHHGFILDRAAFQLRCKSREMTGKATSEDIMRLRALLDLVRRDVHESRRVAMAISTLSADDVRDLVKKEKRVGFGSKTELYRQELRNKIELIDTLADRLSHVVGEHERGLMTDARVTAILGDSRQHLPAMVKRHLTSQSLANAERIRSRQETISTLPMPPPLSNYGAEFTRDAFSCSNAHELAEEGDALFFYLSDIKKDVTVESTLDGPGFISFQSFTVLKHSGMKQTGDANSSFPGVGQPVKSIWMPCYFTQQHFSRALLLLPDALGLLAFSDPLAFDSQCHYTLLFELLGHSAMNMATSQDNVKEVDWVMLTHKMRSLHALSDPHLQILPESYRNPVDKIKSFLENSASTKDSLFTLIPQAMLAIEEIGDQLLPFCVCLRSEFLRRHFASIFKTKPSAKDIENTWLSLFDITSLSAVPNLLSKQTAASLEPSSALAKRIETTVRGEKVFGLDDALKLYVILSSWKNAVKSVGGVKRFTILIDSLFISDDSENLKAFNSFVESLKQVSEVPKVFDTLAPAIVCQVTLSSYSTRAKAWKWVNPLTDAQTIFDAVLGHLNDIHQENVHRINNRGNLIKKHTLSVLPASSFWGTHTCLCGAKYGEAHIQEVWGSQANIDDPVLYREIRQHVLAAKHYPSVSLIDAETEKEYRKRGGTFTFGSGDTFIPGLHQRTRDLLKEWQFASKVSSSDPKTDEMVEEMLLRLRWDDRVPGAKDKLTKILVFLWNAYLGLGPSESDIPTSLL